MKTIFEEVTPTSRQELREWLTQNHSQKSSVWVIIYKYSSPKKNLSAADVAEEALCFGWIDSIPRKGDEEKYKLLISPRKEKSAWSALNKKRVKELIKNNQMTEYGMAKVNLAKKNGSWVKLIPVDRLEIPPELKALLLKNKKANAFFDKIAPSSKRGILEWILSSKKEETRLKRIKETVDLAEIGIRAHHPSDLKKK